LGQRGQKREGKKNLNNQNKKHISTKDKAVRSEILMELIMKMAAFWNVTPCRISDSEEHVGTSLTPIYPTYAVKQFVPSGSTCSVLI
jgi:hypothetical protein